ncbi:Golgin subfamily A member 1 [Turdus rufiventris]|nr:Golgin subfamily A member 1 [Turdus rufiventris]
MPPAASSELLEKELDVSGRAAATAVQTCPELSLENLSQKTTNHREVETCVMTELALKEIMSSGGAEDDIPQAERKTVTDFCYLLDKSKQLFNGLRDLPQYGQKQWQSYFGRTFDVYTKLWKFQQQHRQVLDNRYGLKRWQIGEIASKIGQLYYHYYLRTSETSYLNEAFSFYSAIRQRSYYSQVNKEDRPELVVKKLRYYARFIVVCLLLNKMDVVKDLVKADPVMVLNDDNTIVITSNRLSETGAPLLEQGMIVGQLALADALIIGNCNNQVKFSELTIDMFRMLQALEREPMNLASQMNKPGMQELPANSVLLIYLSATGVFPSGRSDSEGPYDFGGVLTNSNRDIINGDALHKRNQSYKEMHCLHPGDLYPFTRKPLFIIVDSSNSVAYKNFTNLFGQPLVCLLSPTAYPKALQDQSQRGSLFTLFLNNPLMAFLFVSGLSSMRRGLWEKCQDYLRKINRDIAQLLTHSRSIDYADQIRNLQKMKEKLENALEKHQDSSMRKFQEQNEAHQASRAKMAEGMALALGKKDKEWMEILAQVEKEKKMLQTQLQEMREQSLNLFQKRDEIDELEGFQQQEIAKVKHMLLKKEESLSRAEQELEARAQELSQAQAELQAARSESSGLRRDLQELQQHLLQLEARRDELMTAETNAENKITALELREQELQTVIQQLSVDLQNARVAASGCEKRLEMLQVEHESLKVEYEQQKQKMTFEFAERDKLTEELQEKVSSLEKKLERNLSGDEHVQELLKEKAALEQRLEESRQQVLTDRTRHSDTVIQLETQKKELEEKLQIATEALKKSKEAAAEQDLKIQKLQTDLADERNRLQQQILSEKHHYDQKVTELESQIAGLEKAWELDKMTTQDRISQLEKENENLKRSKEECESSLKQHESELNRLKNEMSSRETVSVEIAKALEETRKQREELQQQVSHLNALIKEKDQLIDEKCDLLLKQKEELNQLSQDHEAALLQVHQLQMDIEASQSQAVEKEETARKEIDELKLQVQECLLAREHEKNVLELEESTRALNNEDSPSPENSLVEQNGEVAAADVIQLQKDNRELEQQIAEKNKMIKQLQQRMAELKKTLQKELKIRPDSEVPELRTNSEVPNASVTVTNNSDLNDSREINFEYLKHVVLKFMSCRESEAFHLIKAVSVLLNFSQEEENMLKETLEYKMSWFGSKPSPKGSIRPSISSPRTLWP